MSSSSGSEETDSDEETVSSLEIGDFKDDSGGWSEEVSSSLEEDSSSEEEEDSTEDSSSLNNGKGKAKLGPASSSSSGSFVSDSDESSDDIKPILKSAMKKPVSKGSPGDNDKPKLKSAMKRPVSKESDSDESSSNDSEPKLKSAIKRLVSRKSDSDESSDHKNKPKLKSAMKNGKGKTKPGPASSSSSGSFVSDSDESDESSDDSKPKLKSAMKKSVSKESSGDKNKPKLKSAMKKPLSKESDSDESLSDDSEPKLKSAMKKPAARSVTKKVDDIAPPGISKDAYKRFFSKPVELSPEKPSSRVVSNEPSVAHSRLMIKHAEEEMKQRRNDLNSSQHSLRSCEDLVEQMSKDLLSSMDDIDDKIIGDISIEDESKNYKDMPDKSHARSGLAVLRDKREMRLAKVRERIRAKEQAKEREVDSKKMQEFESKINGGAGFDMSENARRERAYGWYTRMAMPSKAEMKQRVAGMPASSGVRVEDVDLLPWAASGRMVNVAKMQKFISEGFKKKFTPRRTKKPDNDSDSS